MNISKLLFACAITLSTVAAYYSIVGLAAIFSAAYFPVIVMAAVLEISKLVCASWLYQKWNTINNFLKTYLTISVIVLMLITSLGIFGFLTRAHTDQKLNTAEVTLELKNIERQKNLVNESISQLTNQLAQLDRSINIQLDNNRATQALAARNRQQQERAEINSRLEGQRQKLIDLEMQEKSLQQKNNILESELGPIKYIAQLFYSDKNIDYDKAVKYMILVIVLVFDPLAVLMLIAANMSVKPVHTKNVPVGQTYYDLQKNSLMYFDGVDLHPITLGTTTQSQQFSYEEFQERTQHIIKNSLDTHQFPVLQKDVIEDTVKKAMNAWLATTERSSENSLQDPIDQSIKESKIDTHVDVINSNVTLTSSTSGVSLTNNDVSSKPNTWL
jgi:hypothetical protein